MKDEEVNNIMEDITEDSSLCIIREALENYNIKDERYLHFEFNENELIQYLFKFAEYLNGLGTLTEEDKQLISSYVMHKKL